MKLSVFAFLIGALLGVSTVHSQPFALDTGAVLPLLKFSKVVQGDKVITADFRSHKDKAMLLDFWATNCGSCVAKMPEMAKLQQAYQQKLTVFLVTTQPIEEVQAFLRKRPFLQNLNLSIITEDSVLYALFPVRSLPQVVWVDARRKVKAITGGMEVNSHAVAALIRHQLPALPVKRDNLEFDKYKPFSLLNYAHDRIYCYEVLSARIDGVGPSSGFSNYNNQLRYHCINSKAISLLFNAFQYRFGEELPVHTPKELKKHLILEISDSAARQNLERRFLELVCYENIQSLPNTKEGRVELLKGVQARIERHLGIVATVETRTELGFVLEQIPSEQLQTTIKDTSYVLPLGNGETVYAGQPASVIMGAVAYTKFGKNSAYRFNANSPIESLYTITLRRDYETLEEINADLGKVGLRVSQQRQQFPYLVIREVEASFP